VPTLRLRPPCHATAVPRVRRGRAVDSRRQRVLTPRAQTAIPPRTSAVATRFRKRSACLPMQCEHRATETTERDKATMDATEMHPAPSPGSLPFFLRAPCGSVLPVPNLPRPNDGALAKPRSNRRKPRRERRRPHP
jgi:hypothetical protein